MFAVIGAGNQNVPGAFKEEYDSLDGDVEDMPNAEYAEIGLFLGYLASTMRVSLGDFDFDASVYLTKPESWLYWGIWFLTVVIQCIIFLNFIIAEASNSYAVVKENLDQLINKEKSTLVCEAEKMMPDRVKNHNLFPKYIIIR